MGGCEECVGESGLGGEIDGSGAEGCGVELGCWKCTD